MLDILEERAHSIRFEPPAKEDDGFEFLVRWDEYETYHQVKRQTSRGQWSLSQLSDTKVLTNFWQKLRRPGTRCTFASGYSAQELHELSDRARGAANYEEYRQIFLNTSSYARAFDDLSRRWGATSEQATFEALQRISVETISESTLRDVVESRLAALVEGVSTNTRDVLAQFALEDVHREVTAHELWHHLEQRGMHRLRWDRDPHVLARLDEQNRRYVEPLENEMISGRSIPRDEAETVQFLLTGDQPDNKRAVLLSGPAGGGKSGVASQVVTSLKQSGVPFLAFRVDRLQPVATAQAVGEQLDLPGSPANVLAAVAQERRCVLVIDQLDAVSLASGRSATFFDCIEEIIRHSSAHPEMRLLLVSRQYDIDNDHRFKRLKAEHGIASVVQVSPLLHERVMEIVSDFGLESARLTDRQLALLSTPLHLKLLSEVRQAREIQSLDFTTANDLYKMFWDHKLAKVRARADRSVAWTKIINEMCAYMSDLQVLSVPGNHLDELTDDAQLMASEHVLTFDGRNYSFFHEGFFDYAFARRFTAREQLIPFLKNDDQHLFRRAQVRQILLHEREADVGNYLDDLEALIASPGVLVHLKQVALSLLANTLEPLEGELRLLEELAFGANQDMAREAWQALTGSVAWFDLLDRSGRMARWFAGGDTPQRNLAARTLTFSGAVKLRPGRVCDLLEPHLGQEPFFGSLLLDLVRLTDAGPEPRLFEAFLRLIKEGAFDESGFWSYAFGLEKRGAAHACEAIGVYFHRCLVLALERGSLNPFDDKIGTVGHDQLLETTLRETAGEAPEAFVRHILPFVLQVALLNPLSRQVRGWRDEVWTSGLFFPGRNVQGSLLEAVDAALRKLAAEQPRAFSPVAATLKRYNHPLARYLLVNAYEQAGEAFADEAGRYLCGSPDHLEVPWHGEASWGVRRLLEAITPHCSAEVLRELEVRILKYYPTWERLRIDEYVGRDYPALSLGYSQMILLEGFVPERRSIMLTRRLQELRRKFGHERERLVAPRPKGVIAQDVGPPIGTQNASNMTNAQWLRAMSTYQGERMRRSNNGFLIGGARQLADVLQAQVEADPARFATLTQHFPDDAHVAYFEALLRGLADSSVDVETTIQVIERCHRLPERPCGWFIGNLVLKLAERAWPERALQVIDWYATQHTHPHPDSADFLGGRDPDGGLLLQGINSVRGKAAETIAGLIFHHPEYSVHFLPHLDAMVQDPSMAVRACVASVLNSLLNHDRDAAVGLFVKLCEGADTRLLCSPYALDFLFYALPTHLDSLESVLERMMTSPDHDTARIGALRTCVLSLQRKDLPLLANRCLEGDAAHRLGAAEAFAANICYATVRERCEAALRPLFDDPDPEVRKMAASCFRQLRGNQITDHTALVNDFLESQAFLEDSNFLFFALAEVTMPMPELLCHVCERWLDRLTKWRSDNRGWLGGAHHLSDLLLRAYHQAQQGRDTELRRRCLSLVNRVAASGEFDFQKSLGNFER